MPLERAKLIDAQDPQGEANAVEVLFNPTEITIEKSVNYAEAQVPGLQDPLLQFVRGEAETLTTELFLDKTSTRESVSEALASLRKFVEIQADYHAPPVLLFSWGDVQFLGVVTRLSERFQLFDERGQVMRARVSLTMKRFAPADAQYREPPRESPDRSKTRVVHAGDRLDLIAAIEYGDARHWRVIARANQIERPNELRVGEVLEIPPL